MNASTNLEACETLSPDLAQAQRHLELVDPNASAWTFQVFDDMKPAREGFARIFHGTLEEHRELLCAWNAKGAGIFVTVNETDGKGRATENITRVRCLTVDVDKDAHKTLCEIRASGLPPSLIVQSSRRGFHAYWRVDDCELQRFSVLQKALISRFNTDKSVHDLPRVMRIAGFIHRKVGCTPTVSRLVYPKAGSGPTYKVEEVIARAGLRIESGVVISLRGDGSICDDLMHAVAEKQCDDVAQVRSACELIAERGGGIPDRAQWITVAHALKATTKNYPELGLELFHRLSRPYSDYSPEETEKVWTGCNPRMDGAGAGTLFKFAKELGWTYSTPLEEAEGDLKNARWFAQAYRDKLLWSATRKAWMYWRGGVWRKCEHGEEMRAARSVADRMLDVATARMKEEGTDASMASKKLMAAAMRLRNEKALFSMVSLAQSEDGMTCTQDEMDADPWLLNCRDCVVDLRTGARLAHAPSMLMSRQVEASYDEGAECPTWLRFLDTIFRGDVDTIDSVRRALGYCLTGTVGEEKFFFMFGAGANGKSVLCNVVNISMGGYCVVSPPSMLEARTGGGHHGPREDLAQLAGARLALCNETAEGHRWDAQTIKAAVSTEPLSASYKHEHQFTFLPTAKIIVRGNHKPIITDAGDGMWRRLDLWPFLHQVPEGERDHRLQDKLLLERDGILRWLVGGCLDWQRDGLRQSQAIRDASAEYRSDSDTLGQWQSEECVRAAETGCEARELYASYRAWAQAAGLHPVTKNSFTRQLAARGFTRRESNGKSYWKGISIKSPTNA